MKKVGLKKSGCFNDLNTNNQYNLEREMAKKKDLELNEKRINCAIRSFALTANYVGLADGKFDEKEIEEAKKATVIFSNWNSLFYKDREDIDEDQLRSRISEEIGSIASSDDGPAAMLDELKKQFEIAKTLTKYPEIVEKDRGGTADYEKDVSTYTSGSEESADNTMMVYDIRAKMVKQFNKALRKMF